VGVIEKQGMVPLPAEDRALDILSSKLDPSSNPIPAGFWMTLDAELPVLDSSDFVILVRDDLAEDIAYLLTWCLVETKETIERQYYQISPHRSLLTYQPVPAEMANTLLPLHPGARKYHEDAGNHI